MLPSANLEIKSNLAVSPHQCIFRFSSATVWWEVIPKDSCIQSNSFPALNHSAQLPGKWRNSLMYLSLDGAGVLLSCLQTTETRWPWEYLQTYSWIQTIQCQNCKLISPHYSEQAHCSKQSTRTYHRHTLQGREVVMEILIKFFPIQFHLKRLRTAQTDVISQGWLQNLLTFLGMPPKWHEHGLQDSASAKEWLTPLAEFSSHFPPSCLAAVSLQCRRACTADNKQHTSIRATSCPPLLCRYNPSQLNSLTSHQGYQHVLPNAGGNIHAEKHHRWPGQTWNKPVLNFAPTSKPHL